MTPLDKQIQELEKQKKVLQEEQANKLLKEWEDKVRGLTGKYFKEFRAYGYRDKVCTNYITYVKVLGCYKIDKVGEAELSVKTINIACTPVGWTRKEGKLKYIVGENAFSTNKKVEYKSTEVLESGKKYMSDRFYLRSIFDTGGIASGYGSGLANWYSPILEEEFFEVEAKLATLSKEFYNEMLPYCNDGGSYHKAFTEETEEMISEIDEATIKRIDDVLKSGINIKELKETSGKVAKYNYFNGVELPELAQYTLSGDKGCFLNIQGGDDGTDYEPYTTRYYIQSISIDWKTILYPIRTKLKSVLDTASQLVGLEEIYHADNWDCNYDTSSYDAYFLNAKLKKPILDKVNKIIKTNLK